MRVFNLRKKLDGCLNATKHDWSHNDFFWGKKIYDNPYAFHLFFFFFPLASSFTATKHILILTLGFEHWQLLQFSQYLAVRSKDLQQKSIYVFSYMVASKRNCRTANYYITCQGAQSFFFNCIFYGMLKLYLISCCRMKSLQGYSVSHLSTWFYLKEWDVLVSS